MMGNRKRAIGRSRRERKRQEKRDEKQAKAAWGKRGMKGKQRLPGGKEG